MTKAKIFLFLTLALFLHGCSTRGNLVLETRELPPVLQLEKPQEEQEIKVALLEVYCEPLDPAIIHTQNYNAESCDVAILTKSKKAVESYIKINYPKREDEHIKDIAHYLTELSNDHEVDLDLMVAIMELESQFNPHATNKRSKAAGLMQVMPFWAKDFNLGNKMLLYDIKINIESGIKVYKIFLALENGNSQRALYRYVGGCRTYPKKALAISKEFSRHLKEIDT